MPLVLQTRTDDQRTFELAGAGVAGPKGKGGIVVEDVVEAVREFQNDKGEPLKGKALADAARKLAKDRGVEVNEVSAQKIAKFPAELGSAPDRPPLAEVSKQEFDRVFGGGLEPVNDNPEEMVSSQEGSDA